jgi:hypothetical protein
MQMYCYAVLSVDGDLNISIRSIFENEDDAMEWAEMLRYIHSEDEKTKFFTRRHDYFSHEDWKVK